MPRNFGIHGKISALAQLPPEREKITAEETRAEICALFGLDPATATEMDLQKALMAEKGTPLPRRRRRFAFLDI